MTDLLLLPGIGKYTAAAIASMAFDESVPVVDGNVYRVLARYFGIEIDISSGKAFSHFYSLAESLMANSNPSDFNQAIMEFGALFCTPNQPDCERCILQENCHARSNSSQSKLPVKKRKTKVRNRYLHYFLLRHNNTISMRQRSGNDIWKGLFELPLIETNELTSLEELDHPLLETLKEESVILNFEDKIIRHLLSHQVLNVNFVVIDISNPIQIAEALKGYKWFSLEEVEDLPKPVLISNYLDTYLNSIHLQ